MEGVVLEHMCISVGYFLITSIIICVTQVGRSSLHLNARNYRANYRALSMQNMLCAGKIKKS